MLQAVYPKIKNADYDALVIAGGLVTTDGDGGTNSLNDVTYLERMYAAGAGSYFDALSSHPYGFSSPPETRADNNLTDFRRAADQYAVMERNGEGYKRVYATDFGWLLDPTNYSQAACLTDPAWSGRLSQKFDPETHAGYLVRAYQYAYNNWPWMAAMFTFNLDFSVAPWYSTCDPVRWYSIVNADRTPRAAYTALKNMTKTTTR